MYDQNAYQLWEGIKPTLIPMGVQKDSIEQHKLIVRSPQARISFLYDPRERYWLIAVSVRPGEWIEVNGTVIGLVMDAKHYHLYKRPVITLEEYIDYFRVLFTHGGERLILGDQQLIDAIKQAENYATTLYNKELQLEMSRARADKAWQEKRYKDFSNIVAAIAPEDLPASYQLKLKIAQRAQGQGKE